MRSPMRSQQCGGFYKTLATCGAQSGYPSSSTPGDLATWTACVRAFLTPIHGLGSAVATRLLLQEHGPRPRDLFSGRPIGSKGDRSREGPLASRTCVMPSAAPHSTFPTKRGCQFGWSVGRCSFQWCAAARGRPPGSVPNLRRCAARCPRRQGWSLWEPSRSQASGTSNATARATRQSVAHPGCFRSMSAWRTNRVGSPPQAS